jgi:RNA polymerase subunit RPABC4/transcription elongation factor Spt4
LRCRRTPPKETKVCPVCDATIDADAQNCPSCLTDLSLFDLGGDTADESFDVHVGERKSIDDILASIMEGKTDQPEIFETLKSVASTRRNAKNLVPESKAKPTPPPATREELEQQFLCPVCETPVRSDDKVCPGCGAEFSEGESTEYECPVCKAAVPADADHCPSCGVHFAAEEATAAAPQSSSAQEASHVAQGASGASPIGGPVRVASATDKIPSAAPGPPRLGMHAKLASLLDEVSTEQRNLPFGDKKLIARELPKLVNEVKPLLVSAKRIGVQIDEGKKLVNTAVEVGKRKEMDEAVRLISDARRSLDLAFVDFIGKRLESLAAEVDAAGPGDAANLVRPRIESAFSRLTKRDYDGAWDGFQEAKQAFQSQAKEFSEGRKILDATQRLVGEVRDLGMDTRDVERLVRESREAADGHDLADSLRLAKEAQERLLSAVPDFVQEEMRSARNALLDMKVRGGDLTKPVGILKEASSHVKNGEWSEAIRFLREFRKEIANDPMS